MTACIGWKGDTPCPLGPLFHGCKLAEDVTHGYHICACGARVRRHDYELKSLRAPIAAPESATMAAIDAPGDATTSPAPARPTEEVRHG